MKYALIKQRNHDFAYWWEDCGHRFENENGGGFPKLPMCYEIIETAEAECYEDLDHTKTGLLQPDSKAGWLSPDGEFYGCFYASHDALAELVLKTAVCELEKTGWIRVAGARAVLSCDRFPTDAQRDWARDHEHKIREDLQTNEAA